MGLFNWITAYCITSIQGTKLPIRNMCGLPPMHYCYWNHRSVIEVSKQDDITANIIFHVTSISLAQKVQMPINIKLGPNVDNSRSMGRIMGNRLTPLKSGNNNYCKHGRTNCWPANR